MSATQWEKDQKPPERATAKNMGDEFKSTEQAQGTRVNHPEQPRGPKRLSQVRRSRSRGHHYPNKNRFKLLPYTVASGLAQTGAAGARADRAPTSATKDRNAANRWAGLSSVLYGERPYLKEVRK